jgi:hypothetical protein
MTQVLCTSCTQCSFYLGDSCYAGRFDTFGDKVGLGPDGRHVIHGICNLYNQDEGDLEEILIKRRRDVNLAVSFLVIHRGKDLSELLKTIRSVVNSDLTEKTELKVVCMDLSVAEMQSAYESVRELCFGKVKFSMVDRVDKEEDPNLILTGAMKKMKNSFVIVVESGKEVYPTINHSVNYLVNDKLTDIGLLSQTDGNFYGCMMFVAQAVGWFAFEDLGVKLKHLVKEVTVI